MIQSVSKIYFQSSIVESDLIKIKFWMY